MNAHARSSHPDGRGGLVEPRREAWWALAVTIGIVPLILVAGVHPASAQDAEPAPTGVVASDTLVARYAIDPGAFETAEDVETLVRTLRAGLRLEAAMPLEHDLYVSLVSSVGGQPMTRVRHTLDALVPAHGSREASVADLAREAGADVTLVDGSDWTEDAAWGSLPAAIRSGLTQSLVRSERLFREEDGRVSLRVVGVHQVDRDEPLEDRFENDFIYIEPEVDFAQSWEPREGLTYDVRGIVLEVEPGGRLEIELSPEALARLAGTYESEDVRLTVRVEEDGIAAVMVAMGREARLTLTPLSDTRFSGEAAGDPVELAFTLRADGSAESVTLGSGGVQWDTLRRVDR